MRRSLTVSWSEGEPSPGKYRVAEVTRAARILRQSGATVHLDLALVTGRARDVPKDLAGVAFDNPRLSLRLGRFLDALGPDHPLTRAVRENLEAAQRT